MVESLYEHQYYVGRGKTGLREAKQVTGYFYLFAENQGTIRDDIVVFIFPLELEKQSDASVIIKPLLSLKKPVCLGRLANQFFAKKLPLLTNWKIFDKICNWPSY